MITSSNNRVEELNEFLQKRNLADENEAGFGVSQKH